MNIDLEWEQDLDLDLDLELDNTFSWTFFELRATNCTSGFHFPNAGKKWVPFVFKIQMPDDEDPYLKGV